MVTVRMCGECSMQKQGCKVTKAILSMISYWKPPSQVTEVSMKMNMHTN